MSRQKATQFLFYSTALALSQSALSDSGNFTHCRVPAPSTADTQWCMPTPESYPGGNAGTLNLQMGQVSGTDFTVVSVPAQNCRSSNTAELRGTFVVAVDNSESLRQTDPNNLRLDGVATIIDDIGTKASSVSVTTADSTFPQLGFISYGGRAGTYVDASNNAVTTGNPYYYPDGLNPKFTIDPAYCQSADATGNIYPDQRNKWRRYSSTNGEETLADSATLSALPAGAALLSVCEFLQRVPATQAGSLTAAGTTRHKDFNSYTGVLPRGSTDLTYYLASALKTELFGGSTANMKTMIAITDGLPNIPKRIPESTCASTPWLSKAKIYEDPNLPGKRYCLDRQFRLGAQTANDYIVNNDDYRNVNLYNILYTGGSFAYSDTDESGTLFPTDFLAENSARSGNGKVKFKVAKNATEAIEYVRTKILPAAQKTALHHVEVQVNSNPKYNAVSTTDFNKLFSIKLINLVTGSNTVTVTAYYGDIKVTRTYTVNVAVSGTTTSPYECVAQTRSKTVDGDEFTDSNPKGDGVKPDPVASGTRAGSQDRIYRNNDPDDGRNTISFADATLGNASNNLAGLRLQGGTGNCGVIASTPNLSATRVNFATHWLSYALFSLPLLLLFFVRNLFSKLKD